MDWDETKETFQDRPDVPADEKLTADEWNNHVTDQKNHAGRHEDGGSDEVDVSGLSGVLADAQTPQTEAVQDIVGALIQANGNITTTYDDANDTLTIDTTALNEEEVEDAVAALVTAGNAITVNYDDANDALSIAVDESALSFYDGTNLTANVDNESVSTGELSFTAGQFKRLDDNSPWEITGQTSATFSLDSAYKVVVLEVIDGGAGADVDVQANGVSSNYDYILMDGSTGSGSAWSPVTNPGFGIGQEIRLTSGADGQAGIINHSPTGFPGRVHTGRNGSINSPISSITLQASDGASTFDLTSRVWVME